MARIALHQTSLPAAQAPDAQWIRQLDVMPDPMFDDLWERAGMDEVIRYLKGGIFLNVPDEWKGYIESGPPCSTFSSRMDTMEYEPTLVESSD